MELVKESKKSIERWDELEKRYEESSKLVLKQTD
jgi:hypothetical protein